MNEEQLLEIYNDFYKYYSHEEFIEMMIDYEKRKQNQENLIKYIEDKIKVLGICLEKAETEKDIDELSIRRGTFIEMLERIKNNNYEKSDIK